MEQTVEDLPAAPDTPLGEPEGRLVAGRYRLRLVLGSGGMGRVWLAEDEVLGQLVAVKQYRPGPTAAWRARDEARAAALVDHAGSVRVHGLVPHGDLPWLVMEPLSGRTLADRLDDEGPLPVGEVARLGLRLLEALTAVHQAGVVHCDVKPGNVQLCADGRVVLTDFGIARLAGHPPVLPDRTFVGSPAYSSPERLHGAPPDPATDLFSLGATLYAAVEGTAPFLRDDVVTTLSAIVAGDPVPFRRAGPLRTVIAGLLAKDPARRLTADRARAALLAIESQVSECSGSTESPVSRNAGEPCLLGS